MNTGHEDYEWESDAPSNRRLSQRQSDTHTHTSDGPGNGSFGHFSFFFLKCILSY